jgi:glucokinase
VSKKKLAIGADVGGTYSKIILADEAGRILADTQIETQASRGPKKFLRRLADAAISLQRQSGLRAKAIGLGIAGDVDSEAGKLRFSPNLKPFSGFPLRRTLQSYLHLRTAVENDANAAAWGAFVCELKRRPLNMACVTLGTGVGGGLVLNRKLFRGSTGSGGEIGHMCVEADGALCHCGARGCLEAYMGSYGLTGAAEKLMSGPSGRKSLLHRAPGGKLTPQAITDAALKGDAVAKAVWKMGGYYLGLGIASLIYLLNVDNVVIVGGVSKAGRLILDPVIKVLRSKPFQAPLKHARIRIGQKPHLGALGAALLGLEER